MENVEITSNEPSKAAKWQKTSAANIVRYLPNSKLYSRVRVRGRLIRRSLKTKSLSVAQSRLSELANRERRVAASRDALANGKMTFGQALAIFEQRLDADANLKQRSKNYRRERISALVKSWPNLKQTDVSKISKAACLSWAGQFGAKGSAYNNTVGTLRMVLDIAVELGARYDNPAAFIKKVRVRPKQLALPTKAQFLALVAAVEDSRTRYSEHAADLIRFLAFTGCRKSEAGRVTWEDCTETELIVRGDPETGTKNWSVRRVPIIADLQHLLRRLRSERNSEPLSTPVMKLKECQRSLTRACNKIGIPRITHHDLRHLFATQCIELGVDIPTISQWLGHKDGGALAMKTYGHPRNEHSLQMAQRVTFGYVTPENVVALSTRTTAVGGLPDEKQSSIRDKG